MALVRNDYVETVLIEESDERLAAVEQAKMSGEPLQSIAARRTFAVPRDVAQKMLEDASHENIYVGRFGHTYAGHLEEYHEKIKDPNFVLDSNEQKAREHAEYSAELVRKQMEENQRVNELMAEGYEPSIAVQQANLERAREHEAKSASYEGIRAERKADGLTDVPAKIDEMVRVVRAEDLLTKPFDERVAAFEGVTPNFSVSEEYAKEALITKDKIIETAESYTSQTASHEELSKKDRPGVEIMESAGSPEALEEKTAVGQIAANNTTTVAAQDALRQMEEFVAEKPGEEVMDEPGKVLREAEESVDGRPESDELRENPEQ
jgi:uncharacterized membrane-anchored protein YhcB (DUF1043 family)